MKVKNLKHVLDSFDDEKEVIIAIYSMRKDLIESAEICEIVAVKDNNGSCQLDVVSDPFKD